MKRPFTDLHSSRVFRSGFSVLEVLVGMAIFLVILSGVVRLHTEVTLPQQGYIRDYTTAMGICERFANGILEDILKGDPPPETPGNEEKDVTEAIIESTGSDPHFSSFFRSGDGKAATELTVNFKAFLKIKDLGNALGTDIGSPSGRYYSILIRCVWGKQMQHGYVLETRAMRR